MLFSPSLATMPAYYATAYRPYKTDDDGLVARLLTDVSCNFLIKPQRTPTRARTHSNARTAAHTHVCQRVHPRTMKPTCKSTPPSCLWKRTKTEPTFSIISLFHRLHYLKLSADSIFISKKERSVAGEPACRIRSFHFVGCKGSCERTRNAAYHRHTEWEFRASAVV